MTAALETKFLFDKIRKLYPTFEIPDELDIDCWKEVLQGHSQEDILKALKSYRKTVEYNQAPTPGTFAKFLREEREVFRDVTPVVNVFEEPKHTASFFWDKDPAYAYYLMDCESLSVKKVHAVIFYRWALQEIIEQMIDTLPLGKNWNYSQKIAKIRENRWDADITQRVHDIFLERVGENENYPLKQFGRKWRVSDELCG